MPIFMCQTCDVFMFQAAKYLVVPRGLSEARPHPLFLEFLSCIRRGCSGCENTSDEAFAGKLVAIAKSPVKMASIQDQPMVQVVLKNIEHELVCGLGTSSLRGGAGIYFLFVLGGGPEGEGVCSCRRDSGQNAG